MQNGASYVRNSNDFKNKIKNIKIPNNALLVTADIVVLYPSKPENLIKMAEFVLKNTFFEFDSKVFQKIAGTAIWTKFAPPYTCIFMDQLETKFFWKLKHLSL